MSAGSGSSWRCTNNLTRPTASQIVYRNKYWQRLTRGNVDAVLYSAIYDNRSAVGSHPAVRILAVIAGRNDRFYCHLWSAEDPAVATIVPATVLRNGRGHKIGKILYNQFMLTCAVTESASLMSPPTHVSVALMPCDTSTTLLPITLPTRVTNDTVSTTFTHEFGVCVAISFGEVEPASLIEWFEMNRLLGVTEFNIYNATLWSKVDQVMNYYAGSGLLRLHQMPPPVDGLSMDAVKLASPASLNDCMLRNVYSYKHLIVIDFDEVIVPRMHSDYRGLVKALDRVHRLNDTYYSYAFRNAFFLLDFAEAKSASRLQLARRLARAPTSKFLYSAKSFVNPRHCLSVFNHFCYIPFSANSTGSKAPAIVDVHRSLAQVHHYRQCNRLKMDCNKLKEAPQRDDAVLKFERGLFERVHKAHSEMKLTHIA